jgi:pimeloyl-ACP methyl ester carboxylesterase/class 3 adenylate cyclase
VTDAPKVHYVTVDDGAHIAYQVVGSGPRDLVYIPGWVSNLDLAWENPIQAAFFDRLASFSRLILLDKRGTGLSDPVPRDCPPTLERRMDDVRAVMDAVKSSQAAFFGGSEGGPMSILFAATYPGRAVALVLYGSYARRMWAPDYPFGRTEAEFAEQVRLVEEHWGEAPLMDRLLPGLAQFPEMVAQWGRFERLSATPATAGALIGMAAECDVRAVLPTVAVPTLVLHRAADRFVPIEHGRYLAEHIPGARLVELPGDDHIPWDITDRFADEIEVFVTGEQPLPQEDRQLATVLFTDIVASTDQAAQAGDQRWRQILDELDAIVARQVQRFRGRLVKSTGDGHLATFDGPGRAIGCAAALHQAVYRLGIQMRSGLHTGEIELRGEDVGGIAVHVAARVLGYAGPGETLVSAAVPPLVLGSGIEFDDRGEHELKGVPGTWRLLAVEHA